MALSYHQAVGVFTEQINKIGYRVVVDEINHEQACRLLKEATRKNFKKLNEENKLDTLHYYDAESIEDLVEAVMREMLERLYSI